MTSRSITSLEPTPELLSLIFAWTASNGAALKGWTTAEPPARQGVRRNAEVRRVPDRTAVTQQDRLRRFVTDPEPRGRFVRHVTMTLDSDEVVGGFHPGLGEMGIQLVERLAADAAMTAVLEKEHGPLARLGNSRVERSDIGKMFQFHRIVTL